MPKEEKNNPKLPSQSSVLVIVDVQDPLSNAVRSMRPDLLRENVLTVARGAVALDMPIVVTSVTGDEFGAEIWTELKEFEGRLTTLQRNGFNPFSGGELRVKLETHNREIVVFSGVWTEGCVTHAALAALKAGFEVQIAVDCVGSTSEVTNTFAIQRLMQAGCVPVSWRQLLYEWQQTWDGSPTSKTVADLIRNHPESDPSLQRYLDQVNA